LRSSDEPAVLLPVPKREAAFFSATCRVNSTRQFLKSADERVAEIARALHGVTRSGAGLGRIINLFPKRAVLTSFLSPGILRMSHDRRAQRSKMGSYDPSM
jgi:hypothetical protein